MATPKISEHLVMHAVDHGESIPVMVYHNKVMTLRTGLIFMITSTLQFGYNNIVIPLVLIYYIIVELNFIVVCSLDYNIKDI